MTRGIAWATVVATFALVGMEFVLSQSKHTVKTATISQHPKSNIVLITFDALSAEDMSLYGYKLPTTPNIDAFARNATVFTNFYSASTFTTPSVATILTGTYPSDTHVYQLQGRLRDEKVENNLPELLRAGGYVTGAFFSNPHAYYLATDLKSGFDVLPEPAFQQGGLQYLWDETRLLHQDSGFGSRLDEFFELENLWNSQSGVPLELTFRYSPEANFAQARQTLAQMPEGFFLWIHIFPPHNPYLPEPKERGRFLPSDQTSTFEENFGPRWKPYYKRDDQSQVDDRRLRYDEFIASADRAFGEFISELDRSGKLQNTTVIVSADHGESFEGGIYQHETPYLTRPVIHIPLIAKKPGQQQTRKVSFTADQTALAPTILELAGLPKPDWMRGKSLAPWLNLGGENHGQGIAFSQYLERNSSFKPIQHGTIGVIDGQYQYVLDLDTHKGALRPLDQAQFWDLDRTAENPARAEALRAEIYARFRETQPDEPAIISAEP
jgi:arylsulfatase A-like enzyme